MQRTIKIETENGTDKIKMNLRTVTRCGNANGKKVKVNECEYHVNTLDNEFAFDYAYSKYVRENR